MYNRKFMNFDSTNFYFFFMLEYFIFAHVVVIAGIKKEKKKIQLSVDEILRDL